MPYYEHAPRKPEMEKSYNVWGILVAKFTDFGHGATGFRFFNPWSMNVDVLLSVDEASSLIRKNDLLFSIKRGWKPRLR